MVYNRTRLNWKHILVHILALWFINQAIYTLSFLTQTDYVEELRNGTVKKEFDVIRYNSYVLATGLIGIGGLVLGFIQSLILSKKRRWYWVNSLIAFGLLITWNFMPYTELEGKIKALAWYPGSLFYDSIVLYYLINGIILYTVGALLLYLKPIKEFIGGQKNETYNGFEFENKEVVRSTN